MNRLIACWTSWASAGPAADVRLNQEYLPATQAAELELVLLHGWGSNREIWRPLLASVRGWANVTLFNVPGCAPGSGAGENIELPDVLAAVLLSRRSARYIWAGRWVGSWRWSWLLIARSGWPQW